MVSRLLFRSVTLLVVLVSASAVNHFAFRSHAASRRVSPAAEAKHGLTGNYYLGKPGWQTDAPPPPNAFYQIWSDPNDFMLPRTITAPAATRVDAQVAFGQGKGFHVGQKGPRVVWWPSGFAIPQGWAYTEKPWDHFVAAIWKGYIHLPKAGTYYFGTVSNGASAVYLNQARVALNGWGGGELVSDAFSYANEQVQDFVTQGSSGKQPSLGDSRFQYSVPVPVDGPRDLPIEVDYDTAKSPSNWGGIALGIDLFWVTPDSPHDANGKTTASIVPTDALYTEAPGPLEKPVVRSANSTISADFLYFDIGSDHFVTVTVRLADKDGNPVAGKRVSLASVGNQRDEIVQPEKPTNEQGETTGKIRANQTYAVPHDTTIFAADVTDFVDVAQVGHLTFQKIIEAGSFFPDTFSPYYDPNAPEVTPLPMQVGRQVTIRMPLVNRNKFAADVDVIFGIHDWNIGGVEWPEIGRVKNVRLQPGEHKDVSIQWTPERSSIHVCFSVSVSATKVAARLLSSQVLSAALLSYWLPHSGNAEQGALANGGIVRRNIGAVANCDPAGQALYTLLGGGVADFCDVQKGPCPPGSRPIYMMNFHYLNPSASVSESITFDPIGCAPTGPGGGRTLLKKPSPLHISGGKSNPDQSPNPEDNQSSHNDKNGDNQQSSSDNPSDLPIPTAPIDAGKDTAARAMGGSRATCDGFLILAQQANRAGNEAEYHVWMKTYQDCERERGAWNGVVEDPPAAAYRRLAVAASDTPVGYIDGVRVSMERYRAAQAEGDQEWAARHLTAMELYFKRLADAQRRAADDQEAQAKSLPADDANTVAQAQSDFNILFKRLHQSGPTSADRVQLEKLGLTEEQTNSFYDDLTLLDQPLNLQGPRDMLLESAALRRELARRAETVAARPLAAGTEGTPSVQTFDIGNTHDRQETVDLFIRPISIPPDWKLSVANVDERQPGGEALRPGTQPKYPVHELDPGKHYNITLPAKAETKVASVVIPVGEIGARTTARWAVEGKIGNELIGGMVHEMNVPYIIADLQLPPVGSKEVEEELPAPGRPWTRLVAEIAAAIIVLVLLMFFFIFWRRRRRATTET